MDSHISFNREVLRPLIAAARLDLVRAVPGRGPIALMPANTPESAAWIAAAIQAEYPIALLPPSLRPREVDLALRQARPHAFFVDGHLSAAVASPQWERAPERSVSGVRVYLPRGPRPPAGWERWGPGGRIGQLTSGSLGTARMAVRTVEGVQAEVAAVSRRLGLGPGDRVLCLSSIAHSYALCGGLLAGLDAGCTVTLCPGIQDAVALVAAERPTVLFGLGPAYQRMLEDSEGVERSLRGTRYLFSAGAPLPTGLFERFLTRFDVAIRQDYGTTETGTIALDTSEAPDPTAVGTPLEHCEVAIQQGEVAVRSSAVADRYLTTQGPDRVQEPDGWYRTGDRGEMVEGRLCVGGRRRALVTTGRGSIDLALVESALRRVPAIRDVAVVPGIDPGGSVVIRAVVVAETGMSLEEINAAVPAHLRPDEISTRDSLPTSPAGKVLYKYLDE